MRNTIVHQVCEITRMTADLRIRTASQCLAASRE
jgi:hypothetical protein